MDAGPEGGIRSYNMTWSIAYLRDFTLTYRFLCDSLETSCAWSKVPTMVTNMKKVIA